MLKKKTKSEPSQKQPYLTQSCTLHPGIHNVNNCLNIVLLQCQKTYTNFTYNLKAIYDKESLLLRTCECCKQTVLNYEDFSSQSLTVLVAQDNNLILFVSCLQ